MNVAHASEGDEHSLWFDGDDHPLEKIATKDQHRSGITAYGFSKRVH